MNLHPHTRFDLYGVLEGAGRHRDRLESHDGRRALNIGLFIDAVPIHVRSEVQVFLVELLEG